MASRMGATEASLRGRAALKAIMARLPVGDAEGLVTSVLPTPEGYDVELYRASTRRKGDQSLAKARVGHDGQVTVLVSGEPARVA